jgi:4-amino-4-deoxy-L-arabinose transferase-like glycosyltransferase
MHSSTVIPPFKLDSNLKRLLLIVGVLSLLIRVVFISDELRYKSAEEIENMTPDGIGYVHLAKNIVHENVYAQSTIESRQYALRRTPGYPFIYAIFEYFGVAPKGVIIAQAVIAACIPLLVTVLVYLTVRSTLASLVAGLFSAFSPVGIGLSGIILVDLLFAAVFAAGFFFFYIGITYSRNSYIYWSGAVFGVATLIKPALMFWPAFSLSIYYLLTKAAQQKIRWKSLCLFVLIQLLVMASWGTRNYMSEGMFMMSPIGIEALRYYVAPKVEVYADDTFMKSISAEKKKYKRDKLIGDAINTNQSNLFQRDQESIYQQGDSNTFPVLYSQLSSESLTIFKAHPLTTLKVYSMNIRQNLKRRFEYFPEQLPSRSLVFRLMSYSNYITNISQNVVYIVILIHFISFMIPCSKISRGTMVRRFYISLSFFLTFFYFAFLSGTTYWTGARILYPAEFSLAILFAFGLHTIFERLGVSGQKSSKV